MQTVAISIIMPALTSAKKTMKLSSTIRTAIINGQRIYISNENKESFFLFIVD